MSLSVSLQTDTYGFALDFVTISADSQTLTIRKCLCDLQETKQQWALEGVLVGCNQIWQVKSQQHTPWISVQQESLQLMCHG